MYIHTFALKWTAEATEEQKLRAATEVLALQGRIPGLLETHVGKNDSPRGKGHEFGGLMLFSDKQAFEAYFTHPLHEELIAWLMPLVDPAELDFEPVSSREEFKG
jgi:heme-degrading monooxygenase HmoA